MAKNVELIKKTLKDVLEAQKTFKDELENVKVNHVVEEEYTLNV